jgi:GNAT superfamily N-acetyltransferase
MGFRIYEVDRDREAVVRIWREVGWIEDEAHEKALDVFLEGGRSLVADLDGAAECMVNTHPATMRYLEEEIPLCCVTGVTTSRIARKRGLATELLADALQRCVADGAQVAALGVFDQGFYDRLGFGTADYVRTCTFDPAQLTVGETAPTPRRLTPDNWLSVHRARMDRHRTHGAVTLLSPEITHAEMLWSDGGFGLGYVGDDGTLTHHVWLSAKNVEDGPYRVEWATYRSREELLELLALIKGLADQIHTVRMREPGGIQFQDLLRRPFRSQRVTTGSKNPHQMTASAHHQVRILDIAACLARSRVEGDSTRFNLVLSDPIEAHLPSTSGWRGVGGEYTVALGRSPSVDRKLTDGLPTLRASVGAFSRLWLGVRPASGLAWTDDLSGPAELLSDLDRAFRLPAPTTDWDF